LLTGHQRNGQHGGYSYAEIAAKIGHSVARFGIKTSLDEAKKNK